jgi:N-acyl-D-amino-acid deacylase
MFDTIIRGGTVVDGRGGSPYIADIGIKDGLITEIGHISVEARETIDADGALVTPGFVDVHTHYDGQLMWDERLNPSFSHGVTTAVAGNCGVGFAPAGTDHRRQLVELMEGVEDIPGAVLDEGLDWNWRSFPDYLDRLAARQYGLDIAVHMTHSPLRVFVMGERALQHEEATPDDIAAMCDMVREGMAAGAFGFSSARVLEHVSTKGAMVPGTFAEDEELIALARVVGESGRGIFQIVPKGAVGDLKRMAISREDRLAEHRRLEEIARVSGRPLVYTVLQVDSDRDDLDVMLAASEAANEAGLQMRPMIVARPIGLVHMLDSYHIFQMRPSYRSIAHLPRAERAAAMRDPALRQAILTEEDNESAFTGNAIVVPMLKRMQANLPNTYILSDAMDYEPGPERKIENMARLAGKSADEFLYDHYASGEGGNCNVNLSTNYSDGNLDYIHRDLQRPLTVSGGGDGGAHVRMICDASLPTFQLAFWGRARRRGPLLPVETIVAKLAGEPAALYGMNDRGTLELGKRADINVIDHQRLTVGNFEMVNDLPSGAGRFLQNSTGYLATMVAGTVTRRHDHDTGARPGRLVRSTVYA